MGECLVDAHEVHATWRPPPPRLVSREGGVFCLECYLATLADEWAPPSWKAATTRQLAAFLVVEGEDTNTFRVSVALRADFLDRVATSLASLEPQGAKALDAGTEQLARALFALGAGYVPSLAADVVALVAALRQVSAAAAAAPADALGLGLVLAGEVLSALPLVVEEAETRLFNSAEGEALVGAAATRLARRPRFQGENDEEQGLSAWARHAAITILTRAAEREPHVAFAALTAAASNLATSFASARPRSTLAIDLLGLYNVCALHGSVLLGAVLPDDEEGRCNVGEGLRAHLMLDDPVVQHSALDLFVAVSRESPVALAEYLQRLRLAEWMLEACRAARCSEVRSRAAEEILALTVGMRLDASLAPLVIEVAAECAERAADASRQGVHREPPAPGTAGDQVAGELEAQSGRSPADLGVVAQLLQAAFALIPRVGAHGLSAAWGGNAALLAPASTAVSASAAVPARIIQGSLLARLLRAVCKAAVVEQPSTLQGVPPQCMQPAARAVSMTLVLAEALFEVSALVEGVQETACVAEAIFAVVADSTFFRGDEAGSLAALCSLTRRVFRRLLEDVAAAAWGDMSSSPKTPATQWWAACAHLLAAAELMVRRALPRPEAGASEVAAGASVHLVPMASELLWGVLDPPRLAGLAEPPTSLAFHTWTQLVVTLRPHLGAFAASANLGVARAGLRLVLEEPSLALDPAPLALLLAALVLPALLQHVGQGDAASQGPSTLGMYRDRLSFPLPALKAAALSGAMTQPGLLANALRLEFSVCDSARAIVAALVASLAAAGGDAGTLAQQLITTAFLGLGDAKAVSGPSASGSVGTPPRVVLLLAAACAHVSQKEWGNQAAQQRARTLLAGVLSSGMARGVPPLEWLSWTEPALGMPRLTGGLRWLLQARS